MKRYHYIPKGSDVLAIAQRSAKLDKSLEIATFSFIFHVLSQFNCCAGKTGILCPTIEPITQ